MTTRPVNSFPNPALTGVRLPKGVVRSRPWYWFCRQNLRWIVPSLFRVAVFNRHYEPATGGVVYMCNHQSFMDPVLAAFSLYRPMNFMARASLFNRVFGPLISVVNAFPVRRGKADLGALKEAMRRIKSGQQMVVFPEGTRTLDGHIGSFLPGVAFLAQRARATTVPVVIDGAFETWPRTQLLPSPGGRIVVQYGRPYTAEQARSMSAKDFVDRIRRDMIDIQTDVRRRLGRPTLRYDQVASSR